MGRMSEDDDKVPGQDIARSIERLTRLLRGREHEGGLNPAQREALRYLAHANRFSNSPGALTLYLGATKGTVSQTLIALERKGFVTKSDRAGERRSVALALTPKAKAALAGDPWVQLAETADGLGNKTRRRLAKGLRELLAAELASGSHRSFGSCRTCRYFREKGRDKDQGGPHLCMAFEAPLTAAEVDLVCVEHQTR